MHVTKDKNVFSIENIQQTGHICSADNECPTGILLACNLNTSQCECAANHQYNADQQICVECNADELCGQMWVLRWLVL